MTQPWEYLPWEQVPQVDRDRRIQEWIDAQSARTTPQYDDASIYPTPDNKTWGRTAADFVAPQWTKYMQGELGPGQVPGPDAIPEMVGMLPFMKLAGLMGLGVKALPKIETAAMSGLGSKLGGIAGKAKDWANRELVGNLPEIYNELSGDAAAWLGRKLGTSGPVTTEAVMKGISGLPRKAYETGLGEVFDRPPWQTMTEEMRAPYIDQYRSMAEQEFRRKFRPSRADIAQVRGLVNKHYPDENMPGRDYLVNQAMNDALKALPGLKPVSEDAIQEMARRMAEQSYRGGTAQKLGNTVSGAFDVGRAMANKGMNWVEEDLLPYIQTNNPARTANKGRTGRVYNEKLMVDLLPEREQNWYGKMLKPERQVYGNLGGTGKRAAQLAERDLLGPTFKTPGDKQARRDIGTVAQSLYENVWPWMDPRQSSLAKTVIGGTALNQAPRLGGGGTFLGDLPDFMGSLYDLLSMAGSGGGNSEGMRRPRFNMEGDMRY